MSFDAIRRFVSARPFKPLVNYPKIIVTEMMIVSVDDHGQLIYIAPEAVSAVRYARSTNRRMRGGTQIHKTKTLNSCNQYWPHIGLMPLSDLMIRSI